MMKSTKRAVVVALAIGIALPGFALAHEATKGPNGGSLIDVEGHHVEFVPAADAIIFFLTDENEAPISAAGAKMKAIVQDGGKTTQLDLSAIEPNKLSASTAAPLSSGAKVVVTGTLSDGHKIQGRFVVP